MYGGVPSSLRSRTQNQYRIVNVISEHQCSAVTPHVELIHSNAQASLIQKVDSQFLPRSGAMQPQRAHNFAPARFHVPTWCTHCKFFVRNPFGIQGYHCDRCHAQIHKDCLNAAAATPCGVTCACICVIDRRLIFCVSAYTPPITPKKMNAVFAQVTQKAVSGNFTAATCTLSAAPCTDNPSSFTQRLTGSFWQS